VNQYGYRGDSETYDDLQNANLMRVIDRRKGLPVALGVLYLHAARAQGLMAMGLNFPGHFYIRLDMGGERVILDPFHGGAVREAAELRAQLKQASGGDAELRPQHYEAVGDKAVLIRLQNNIKMRLLRQGDLEGAARQLDRMLRLMPGNGALWLEAGMLNARLEKLGAAVEALQNCLDRSRDDIHRHQAAALLQRLKSKLN
jgi:regulator of sirC expression with transglutaminase-like and TPR domain